MALTSSLKSCTNRFRDFLFRSLRPGLQEESLARIKEHQNAGRCFTHKLPVEILLNIANRLDGADLLLFFCSCRWLRSLQKIDSLAKRISSQDLKRFTDRMKVDHYIRLAAKEVRSEKEKTLLCRSCLTSHPVAAFVNAEKSRPAERRACFGSSAHFVWCDHHSMTLSELLAKVKHEKTMYCKKQHGNLVDKYCQVVFARFDSSRDLFASAKTIVRIKSSQSPTPIFWTQIQAHLHFLDLYICPHMRTSSPGLVRQLHLLHKEIGKDGKDFVRVRIDAPVFSSGDATSYARMQCENRYCKTSVMVMRFVHCPFLTLEIVRDLGDLRDAMDPRWCAQLEARVDGGGSDARGF